MSRDPNAPVCPKVQQLEDLIEEVTALPNVNDELRNSLVNALDWLATHLGNRQVYHKRVNTRKKLVMQLMRERLGDDLQDIDDQAKRLAEGELQKWAGGGE